MLRPSYAATRTESEQVVAWIDPSSRSQRIKHATVAEEYMSSWLNTDEIIASGENMRDPSTYPSSITRSSALRVRPRPKRRRTLPAPTAADGSRRGSDDYPMFRDLEQP
jgi:hypothetical protein